MKIPRLLWFCLAGSLVSVAPACGNSNGDAPSSGVSGASSSGAAPVSGGSGNQRGGATSTGGVNSNGAGGSSTAAGNASVDGGAAEGGSSSGGSNEAGKPAEGGVSAGGVHDGGHTGDAGGPIVGGGESSTSGGGSGGPYDPDGTPAVLWVVLPSISDIDDIPDTDVDGQMRVISQHDGTHADPAAFATLPAEVETSVTLHVRGNSSSGFAKKSYALELHDSGGSQVKLKLLGMPKESDWVLHGPYSDKTYLRNALAYWLGREIYRASDGNIEPGRWNPRTRFTEVYINAEYVGVYVLIEKIKADSDRVDVDRPAVSAASGDLTGGYIIRREGAGDISEGKDWVSSVDELVYTHHYPRLEDSSPDQLSYIRGYFDDFESLMASDHWDDANTGYLPRIDLTSWLDYFLAMEWSNNIDGYFKSVYFVKHADTKGGALSLGPLWDFDIAFGNANYRNGDHVENWVHEMMGTEDTAYDPPGAVPFIAPYFAKLWTDPNFTRALSCRWQTLRAGPLASSTVGARLDAWAKQLAQAEKRDHQRWPVLGKKLWPNPVAWNTYAEEVSYLKTFTARRFEFLDASLPELGPGNCP
jgi:hypothetical protein